MKIVRWGVLGIGRHFIMRTLLPMKKSEMVELYAVASRSGEKARLTAEKYDIPHHYSSYEGLLADETIEAVFLPIPNHIHLEWIKKAADAGKHILCEKPLVLNASEAREAFEYTRGKGVLLMEAFMYRFHPQWQKVLDIVRIGGIGTVRSVQCFFGYNNNDPNNIRNILEMGGGGLYDLGCYAVSSARYIFEREPKRVMGLINRDPSFKTDILTSGILDFGEGHAVFTVGTKTYRSQKLEITGTSGTITIDIPFNPYDDIPVTTTITDGGGSREIKIGPYDQYELQFTQFSEAIRSEGEPPVPPEDAINNLCVMDAIFRSEKSGNWEQVDG